MTGRLQLIEQKLIAIDSAGFQNLCDTYIHLREDEYSSLNRTGSQLGKQKTVKGTPDTFIRLTDRKLAFIEYTTQQESKVSKIKTDIDSCLNSSKTGVEQKSINQIIICFNSRLSVEEEIDIQEYAQTKNIILKLIGIDVLALEILSKYFLLAREFLDIPIDTGQILPFDIFIQEYNHKANQLSTPLNNQFLHREDELKILKDNLKKVDLIIISGAPGVGKTKIGLEVINSFIEDTPSFNAFAISKKDVDIFEDLKIHLKLDNDYILFVDDANRQLPNFNQILGVFREHRKGQIKIVVTVRNYALSDIDKICDDFNSRRIIIQKFTDEQIIDIIKSDSFKILNHRFQKKIVNIADGNVRLAIMGARLAKKKQADFLWGDVSDLFDSYFKTFLKDLDIFKNKDLLKTLSIISFFFTINRENKIFENTLLKLFNIDYYVFNQCIEELHEKELIEVQFNNARISEQTLATYFFYKGFIKDSLLSFKTLLFNYFPEAKQLFQDSIIPANNSFGYENVLNKINGDLDDYFLSIRSNVKTTLEFFDLFWFYKPEDTILYFYEKIKSIPEAVDPEYKVSCEKNKFESEKDQTLEFLSKFYYHYSEWYSSAIELGFEYVKREPARFSELIDNIKIVLLFDQKDSEINFKRQVEFINLLLDKFNKGKKNYICSFFPIAKISLQLSFHHSTWRGENTFTMYDYKLPFCQIITDLRSNIWKTLFNCYDDLPDEVFDVLKEYKMEHNKYDPEIVDYDLSLLIPFIKKNLSPLNFEHVYFIHEMIHQLDMQRMIKNRSYRELKSIYTTPEYLDFCVLRWDRFRDKNQYEFSDFREYERLKSKEVCNKFIFSSEFEFEQLYRTIENIIQVKNDDSFLLGKAIDIALKENFLKNNELGILLLKGVLDRFPSKQFFFVRTIQTITKFSKIRCLDLWKMIQNRDDENSLNWKIRFFTYIPDDFINSFYYERLMETVAIIDRGIYVPTKEYLKFDIFNEDIIIDIVRIIVKKIDKKGLKIAFDEEIFEDKTNMAQLEYQLVKRAYFQQYNLNYFQTFDYHKSGFGTIYERVPMFLIAFAKEFLTNKTRMDIEDRGGKLSVIWNYPNRQKLVHRAFDLIIGNTYYVGILEHTLNIFFRDLNGEIKRIAYECLLNYLERNKTKPNKIVVIFDVIRFSFNEKFEEAFLFYLSLNSNLDDFTEIDWAGNVGTQSGGVLFGELYAKRWEKILRYVDKSDNILEMIPIKNYIKNRVSIESKYAEKERKRKFLNPGF